jgi:hypothetical protein
VRLATAVDGGSSGAAQHLAAARSRAAKRLLLQVRTELSSPILFPIGDGSILLFPSVVGCSGDESIPALGRGR